MLMNSVDDKNVEVVKKSEEIKLSKAEKLAKKLAEQQKKIEDEGKKLKKLQDELNEEMRVKRNDKIVRLGNALLKQFGENFDVADLEKLLKTVKSNDKT